MHPKVPLAEFVKRVLEEETGDSFVLKQQSELVHSNGTSWMAHLPPGKSKGWIEQAYQKGDKVILQTPVFFDSLSRAQTDYPKQLHKKRLEKAIKEFQRKEVRSKYAEVVPNVATFFDVLEEAISETNKARSTKINIVNENGVVLAQVELSELEAASEESLRNTVKAIKQVDLQVSEWLQRG